MRGYRSRVGLLALSLLAGADGALSLGRGAFGAPPGEAARGTALYSSENAPASPLLNQSMEPMGGSGRPVMDGRTVPRDGGARARHSPPLSTRLSPSFPAGQRGNERPGRNGFGAGLLGLEASPANTPPRGSSAADRPSFGTEARQLDRPPLPSARRHHDPVRPSG